LISNYLNSNTIGAHRIRGLRNVQDASCPVSIIKLSRGSRPPGRGSRPDEGDDERQAWDVRPAPLGGQHVRLLEFALQKQRSNAERPHAFLELRHAWDHLKPEQWERRREEAVQYQLRLDSSHPPTTDRIEVVQRHALPATVVLSAERVKRIQDEPTPFVARIEAEAYDLFRERYSSY
jgi:hypothetical protein